MLAGINFSKPYPSNSDIASLMAALANNPAAAQRIINLDFTNHQLTSINVQGLSALEYLYLQGNHLTSINVQGLKALKSLVLEGNQLTSVERTRNTSP